MKKRNYLLLLLIFTINFSIAQVGIGTTTPNSQLDIRSSNQAIPANNDGILIPKVDVFPATNPTVAQQGMLVYLTTATIFSGNPKTIGFYYWNNPTTDWIGISSAANGDHDWYEEGTTLAPNAITDDMFHTGNVAIGKNTADYPLDIQTSAFDIGIINNLTTDTSTGSKEGIRNIVSNIASTDNLIGISNSVQGSSSTNLTGIRNTVFGFQNNASSFGSYNSILSTTVIGGEQIGTYNQVQSEYNSPAFGTKTILSGLSSNGNKYGNSNLIFSSGDGFHYGTENILSGGGNGIHYGVFNTISGAGTGQQFGSFTTISNTGDGYHAGAEIDLSGIGNGGQYGVSTTITNTGNANHYGIANRLTTSGIGAQYGAYNIISGIGNGLATGTYNQINNSGSGDKIGVQNDISSNVGTNHYGVKNSLTGIGNATKYGVRSDLSASGSSFGYGVYSFITGNSTSVQIGSYNEIITSGTSNHYGNYNNLGGAGSGYQYGNYNIISNTSTGNHYGVFNALNGLGNGDKYGCYNYILPFGGGTQYGIYSEVLKPGVTNFAGYFLGNVGIGTTAANIYTFPPSRGTNNQIMVTNATGVVSWQNASAIQDHDWYEVGTTLAPDAITDVMFHTGNISIGKNTNTFPLDVTSATRTINSVTTLGTSAAIFGFNNAAAGAGAGGYGIAGQTNQSGSQAIRGEQINAGGYAIAGINFGAAGAGFGSGLYGQTAQSGGNGLDSRNTNASGTSIYSAGQNAAGTYLIAGSGGSFNGVTTGIHARNSSLGISEAIYSDNGGIVARVNYWNGATQFKILGAGTVSTTAENINGERVILYCPEAPEILFEDYGQSQLVNGSVHIEIDPTVAKNIVVNDKHPLRVYIQLEDDCKGVYVTNKTGSSFDVKELASGQSNAKFQYHIVGNRADEVLPNGRVSKNADMRFELAPKDKETREATSVDMGKPANVK